MKFTFSIVVLLWGACMGAPFISMWNMTTLSNTKQAILSGSYKFKPAIVSLIASADAYLYLSPPSVTKGGLVPPSGDKHDYWTLGTYWWPCYWDAPNISTGCNTSTGIPWVDRDGHFSPYSDLNGDKAAWLELASAIYTLSLSYYFTDNETYATKSVELVSTWFINETTTMLPDLNYAQQHPGINNGSKEGIIDFKGMGDIDCFNQIGGILNALALLNGSESWTPDLDASFQSWLSQYLNWLMTSPLGKAEGAAINNHGIWYDLQTATIAYYIGRTDIGDQILNREGPYRIATEISPNGTLQYEITRTNSLFYCWYALSALCDVAELGRARGINIWNYTSPTNANIKLAIDFMVPFVIGKSQWEHSQILPFDLGNFFPIFRRASVAFQDPYYEFLISMLPNENFSNSTVNFFWPPIF